MDKKEQFFAFERHDTGINAYIQSSKDGNDPDRTMIGKIEYIGEVPDNPKWIGALAGLLERKEPETYIPTPDKKVYNYETSTAMEHMFRAPQPVYTLDRVEYPDDGGIFVYLVGLNHPTKGFPTPEACDAVNVAKRMFISQVRVLAKNKLQMLSMLSMNNVGKWLEASNQNSRVAIERFILKQNRYTAVCQELRILTKQFLMGIGINSETAEQTSLMFTTMLQYDNAYILRIQDLANETTAEDLAFNPRKELKRLLYLLGERDDREELNDKFASLYKILSFALLIPKVKRSLCNALNMIDWTKIQMDEADYYHSLRWATYRVGGRTDADRQAEFLAIHDGVAPKMQVIQTGK